MDIGMILAQRFAGKKWTLSGDGKYEDIVWMDESDKPSLPQLREMWEDVRVEAHNAEMEQLRKFYYQNESDPIFFDYQRGEATKEDWLNKVEEIKSRYPYLPLS